jgi:hypothetical protein
MLRHGEGIEEPVLFHDVLLTLTFTEQLLV